jgi:hypothetical protein
MFFRKFCKGSPVKYVVGTGWWCGPRSAKQTLGSELIRGAAFHHLWYESLVTHCAPDKILIVDSASPIKPKLESQDSRLQMLSLAINPGHASAHVGQYSGWLASVLVTLDYALCSDADYYVYVEQDALLFGEGIVERCIQLMRRPYMFGAGAGTPQPLQQSFFVIRRDGMRQFLARVHCISRKDLEISPEWKFVRGAGGLLRWVPEWVLVVGQKSRVLREIVSAFTHEGGFDVLPFGFGRVRPIDFDQPFFYFQHGSAEEIGRYLALLPERSRGRVERKAPELTHALRNAGKAEQ